MSEPPAVDPGSPLGSKPAPDFKLLDQFGRTVTLIALPGLLGPILGPLVGGAILTHLSWRFMFWVNVPFCVIGILLAWRYLNVDAPARAAPA